MTTDDELIDAMLVAMYDDGCPGAVDSMRAVLAVVREHDAATVAALREAAEGALHALESSRVFVTSRERCHKPDGEAWYDERVAKLRAALKGAE